MRLWRETFHSRYTQNPKVVGIPSCFPDRPQSASCSISLHYPESLSTTSGKACGLVALSCLTERAIVPVTSRECFDRVEGVRLVWILLRNVTRDRNSMEGLTPKPEVHHRSQTSSACPGSCLRFLSAWSHFVFYSWRVERCQKGAGNITANIGRHLLLLPVSCYWLYLTPNVTSHRKKLCYSRATPARTRVKLLRKSCSDNPDVWHNKILYQNFTSQQK